MSLECAFQKFKEKCNFEKWIITWKKREKKFFLFIYCLEKDIDILKEKKRLSKLLIKHGVWWGDSWDNDFELEKWWAVRPTYKSTFKFTFKRKDSLFYH